MVTATGLDDAVHDLWEDVQWGSYGEKREFEKKKKLTYLLCRRLRDAWEPRGP